MRASAAARSPPAMTFRPMKMGHGVLTSPRAVRLHTAAYFARQSIQAPSTAPTTLLTPILVVLASVH